MSIKNKLSSFNTKTAIYLTTFVVIMIILLWSSVIFLFSYFFEKYQLQMVNNIAADLPSDINQLDATLDKLAYENEVCIMRTDGYSVEGEYNIKLIGCALGDQDERIIAMQKEFIDSNNDRYQYRFINQSEKTSAVLLAIKHYDQSIFIYANLEDTSVVTNLFVDQILYLSLGAIVISIVLSYILSKKITGPIINITKKAKYIGTSKKVEFEKYDIKEIDELVDSLNLAQNEIGQTNKFKQDLMANVSHDLKTPLTMIKAYAEMIKDISYKDKDKLDEHVSIIVDEADRLTLLVNDILDMTKLQDNKESLNVEKYNLIDEINKLVNKYQIIKETEKYNFIITTPKKLFVKADKSKINQVIYNLVNNAINYTGEDKKIIINIKRISPIEHILEITDTGKGIKEKDLNNIWDKYYKTEKNHKRNVVSSGIGLSIVKEILLLHNFEYGVKTSSKGTTFYFIIK